MNKLVFLGLLLAGFGWAACTGAPPTDCRRFQTGDFTFRHHDAQGGFSYLISRRTGIQTETDQQTGTVSRLAIKWTGPCTYELRLLESTDRFPPAVQAMRKKSPLRTEILSYTDTYYVFRSQRVGSDFVVTDTLWIKK